MDTRMAERFDTVRKYSKSVRASEYHLTNACNIRCKGCWFFTHEFDKPGAKSEKEINDLLALEEFVLRERARGVNTALLIGGEPTLFPDRISLYVKHMEHVTISTNGLRPLPREGYEDVNVAITLFGGIRSDDGLRAIRPNGKAFSGLFETALQNYRGDDRAIFIYAVTPNHLSEIRPTVERIIENGNVLSFNYYHDYSNAGEYAAEVLELLNLLLELKETYPRQIRSHPYHIRALITGEVHFGRFGFDTCPSVSVDYADNQARLANGNKYLPKFNAWAADLKTVLKCCTSGECNSCRDSQAVYTWLLVNAEHFLSSPEHIATWTEIAESYWSQFTWSPYSPYRQVEPDALRQLG
jgi:Radical SAM superfamily